MRVTEIVTGSTIWWIQKSGRVSRKFETQIKTQNNDCFLIDVLEGRPRIPTTENPVTSLIWSKLCEKLNLQSASHWPHDCLSIATAYRSLPVCIIGNNKTFHLFKVGQIIWLTYPTNSGEQFCARVTAVCPRAVADPRKAPVASVWQRSRLIHFHFWPTLVATFQCSD